MISNIFKTVLNPSNLAIIGASRSPNKIGHQILKNLITDGYGGNLYPVNPNARVILGHRCYPSLSHLPKVPDLAIIVTPAPLVVPILSEAGQLGVKAVVVISAGFAESGSNGKLIQQQLVQSFSKSNIRLLGPNCLGVLNPYAGLNAAFGPRLPKKGTVMLISQSGALVTGILDWLNLTKLGLSSAITLGNRLDINENEALEYAANDIHTKIILVYLESFFDAPNFFSKASKITPLKPIIFLKGGSTLAGQTASASHTAALATNQILIDALCQQTGVIQAKDYESWLTTATFFSVSPLFKGCRLTVVTNAGGPGVLAADALTKSGLQLSKLPHDPNPLDILGDATPDDFARALNRISQSPTDGIMVLMTPQTNTRPQMAATAIINSLKPFKKPKAAILIGGSKLETAKREFMKVNFPVFAYPDEAVTVLAAKALYDTHKNKVQVFPTDYQHHQSIIKPESILGLDDIFKALKLANYNLPKYQIINTLEAIPEALHRVGQPAVMKTAGLRIPHKAKVGGVILDIMTNSQARLAFRRLRTLHPEILLQQTVHGQIELIIGVKRDPQLGPFLTCGFGGSLTNALADRAYAFIPTSKSYLKQIFMTTKANAACRALHLSIDPVIDVLDRFSQLFLNNPSVDEMEINPAILTPKSLYLVDFKITFKENPVVNNQGFT